MFNSVQSCWSVAIARWFDSEVLRLMMAVELRFLTFEAKK